jgi:hypothetical protein
MRGNVTFTTEEQHKKAEDEMKARLSGPRYALCITEGGVE